VSLAGPLCLALLVLGSASWGVLALAYFDHKRAAVRIALAAAFALVALAALAGLAVQQWRGFAIAAYSAVFALLLWRWLSIAPSNERDWKPENARLAHATIAGDQVTLHNIRNFDYRTETDFTPAYYDRTFDLRQLDSVDLVASYWMGPAIAHVFLSFGFAGRHVAISIEARAERGEGYSSIKGFFRQYELFYVVADERDVIRVRTNYRRDPPEDVYLYRLRGSKDDARRLFLEFLAEINRLKERPEFYNTVVTNCTANIWLHSRVVPGHLPYSWRILVSGYVPELLYDKGRLDTSLPFAELKRRSRINELARAADRAEDFSRRIRAPIGPT
jgi:membrane protein implicated in regulation of membrane protease activity